ncbi:MAG: hemolysin family protein [Cyanobacteria bacterium J06638_22]
MLNLLLLTVLVIGGSALCSGTETALLSVPQTRVRQLAQSERKSARALLRIREKISRPIATLVIFNNLFNILGSIAIGRTASIVLGDALLGVFSGLLTFLIIIFAEILPKTFGERYSEQVSLAVAPVIVGLTILFTPIVVVLEQITAPFIRGERRPITNETEIQLLARLGQQEGVIERDEFEMIQQVFRLNDVTARDLMTPRVAITHLSGDMTLVEAKNDIFASQHSRIIVSGESLDEVVGIVMRNELLTALIQGKQHSAIASLARPAHFIPQSLRANKLLKDFQAGREHLAVVVDEYGVLAGVVTLEDVLEVLIGEIVDETDRAIDLQEIARRRGIRILGRGQTAERQGKGKKVR